MAPKPPFEHPDDWPVVRLSDITTKIGSGATPTGGQEAYLATRQRYALVRSQNVFDRRFDAGGLAFISDDQAVRLAGVTLQRGDLLLNITGDGVTFGRACEVPSDVLPACVNQHVAIVRLDRNKADPRYVLAFLTHPLVKPYIEAFNSGGSRRAITKGHIESFLIPVPPLEEQAAIGAILGALDDKIDLNRRMNETLEAMARAIFHDWFVTFGPTRAKQEARPPYLAPDLWSLFPNRLDDEGKPEGWSVTSLGSFVEHARQALSPAVFPTEMFDHYSLPAFDAGLEPVTEIGAGILSNKTIVPQEAILVSKLNPEIPRVWLTEAGRSLRGICSTEFIALTPSGHAGRSFIYNVFSDAGIRQRLGAMVTGTSKSHQRVQPASMLALSIVKPPGKLLAAYEVVTAPLLERVISNRRECKTLAATRDLLLPKLMSGELRVRDAKRVAETVL